MPSPLLRLADRHPVLFFALLQLAVWTAYAAGSYVTLLPKVEPGEYVPFALVKATVVITGPAISTVLYLVCRWLDARRLALLLRVAVLVVTVHLLSRTWGTIDRVPIVWLFDQTPLRIDWRRFGMFGVSSYQMLLLAWIGGYYALRYWRQLQLRERALLEYQVAARDAQLRALAYQLNPHFLFNTLNSIRALILEDQHRAREMVTRLAGFLRHTLSLPEGGQSTIAEELDAVRGYLAIEEVRFEERLRVVWEVDERVLSVAVPSLILQPLVENAIRHGEPGADGSLAIDIAAVLDAGVVRLTVANTGALSGATPTQGGGVGLDNVRRRLAHAFPDRHSLGIGQDHGWVRVDVRLAVEPRATTGPAHLAEAGARASAGVPT